MVGVGIREGVEGLDEADGGDVGSLGSELSGEKVGVAQELLVGELNAGCDVLEAAGGPIADGRVLIIECLSCEVEGLRGVEIREDDGGVEACLEAGVAQEGAEFIDEYEGVGVAEGVGGIGSCEGGCQVATGSFAKIGIRLDQDEDSLSGDRAELLFGLLGDRGRLDDLSGDTVLREEGCWQHGESQCCGNKGFVGCVGTTHRQLTRSLNSTSG